jgi:hypothetical protein
MMHRFVLGLCCWLLCLAAAPAVAETPFAPGQVWTLVDPDFPQAKIIVDKVEMWNNQPIVHISITGVQTPAVAGQSHSFTTVEHMPFTQAALRASVDALVQTDGQPFAGFEGGYQQWQDAKGGVFTIPVGQALRSALGMVQSAQPQPSNGDKGSGAVN